MTSSQIDHNAWVVVADGGRVLVMRNDGTAQTPKLTMVRKYGQNNPPARDQGSDKPGRTNESTSTRRSAMEATDYHQQAEDRLLQEVAKALEEDLRLKAFATLIVAADPTALGTLRKAMSGELKNTITAEVPKNFTHLHLPELGQALDKALQAA